MRRKIKYEEKGGGGRNRRGKREEKKRRRRKRMEALMLLRGTDKGLPRLRMISYLTKNAKKTPRDTPSPRLQRQSTTH